MLDRADERTLVQLALDDGQVFENVVMAIYSELLRPGDACVDGGANRGLHTLPMARLVGTTGRVIAVEPVPETADSLEALLRDKELHNVDVVRKALFHERGVVTFNVVMNAPTRSGIYESEYPFDAQVQRIEVETDRLDELLADVERLRFCKLDLEGAEFRALQGAERTLARCGPTVVFEVSLSAPATYGYEPAELFAFFDGLGYETFDLLGRPITLDRWNEPGRPWYATAVKAGSESHAILEHRLPEILRELLARARDPVTESTPIPEPNGAPMLFARPNPVPAGPGAGTTVLHWDTGDGSDGEIYISVNGDPERLFFQGGRGSQPAPWINAWGHYEFRLYRGREREEHLRSITVTRRKP